MADNNNAAGEVVESARWRCATIASLVFHIIVALFLIIGLAVDVIMSAKGNGFDVKFGYFNTKVCSTIVDVCTTEVTIDDLTCGNSGGVKAGAAFNILALLVVAVVLFFNGWELGRRSEILPHTTMVGMIVAGVFMLIANIALGDVRAKAKYDAQSCPNTIPGLERYALGFTWWFGLCIGLVFVAIAFITYVARRYCKCCGCCCPYQEPEQPNNTVVVQGQPVNGDKQV